MEAVWFERLTSGTRSRSGTRSTLGRVERVQVVVVGETEVRIRHEDGAERQVPAKDVYPIPEQWPEILRLVHRYFGGSPR